MTSIRKIYSQTLSSTHGRKIGVVTLNSPESLNALDLNMVCDLYQILRKWESDDDVVCVFLSGAGDKAFCAGGDVVSLYHASAAYDEALPNDLGELFFLHEYRLDYLIHTYSKPVVVWANGIVMGGGLGLLSGASHRVVTESTRMAMPEVTIGLYPDVGATRFLNNMPEGVGEFLGVTGADMNARDAIYTGLADFFVAHNKKETALSSLVAIDWLSEGSDIPDKINDVLQSLGRTDSSAILAGNIEVNSAYIQSLIDLEFRQKLESIVALNDASEWLMKASNQLKNGCPVSPFLVNEQISRGKDMSLQEVFRFELIFSCNALKLGHFKEGVRARLIDKDRAPFWYPACFDDVKQKDVAAFYQSPWPDADHPLADLDRRVF